MIAFLQPLALLGLAAAAIPPLLHLIGRKLPPTVVFPAVRYLVATEREHSRRLKLRNLLLMLLRMAIIVLIVLAASAPVARIGAGRGHPATALALIVDNSLSSGAVVDGRPMLDWLIQRAQAVLARLDRDDRLWLVLADGLPRRVGLGEARAIVDSLSPWPVRLDLSRAVRASAIAVAGATEPGREVVVLSDLQRSALGVGDPPLVPVLVWRPPDLPPNRAVDSARSEPRDWDPVGTVIVAIGGTTAAAGAVRLLIDGRVRARDVAAPGDRVVLGSRAPGFGWFVGSVQLDADELRADDGWWVAIHAAPPAATTAEVGAGTFVREAVGVLQSGGRLTMGDAVTLADELRPGATILFPPSDPALLGAVNRALVARGVGWTFGDLVEGEWTLAGDLGPAGGAAVYRRYRLEGDGQVFARAGDEPWLVRSGDVVMVASRMEVAWTALPVTAAFVPFIDFVTNRLAARKAWVVRATPGAMVDLPAGVEAVEGPRATLTVPADRRLRVPLEPGVYFLRSGPDTVGAIEVNHDRRESDLVRADRRTMAATLGAGVRLLDDRGLDRELFGGERRASLAGLLLAGALVAALLEIALATAAARVKTED